MAVRYGLFKSPGTSLNIDKQPSMTGSVDTRLSKLKKKTSGLSERLNNVSMDAYGAGQ